jgi:hypothetical protein
MNTYSIFRASLLTAIGLLFLSACGGGGGDGGGANYGVPPTITIINPSTEPSYTTNSTTVTISGIASDDGELDRITWSTDTGAEGVAQGTDEWSYVGLSLTQGVTTTVTFTAWDTDNNSTSDTIAITYDVGVDGAPPQISITSPSSNPTYTANGSSINLGGTASDDIGVVQVSWRNSANGSTGLANGTDQWSYNNLNLEPGTNQITVTARDAVNNVGSATITVTYTVTDAAPPQISITSPEADGNYTTGTNVVSISGSSSDDIGVTRIKYTNNNGPETDTVTRNPWYFNNINLVPGNNNIVVTAYDATNNQTTATINVFYEEQQTAESCMSCHNGSLKNDYAGGQLMNPHPFAGAQNIRCTVCHGGNGDGVNKDGSHVPPPPQIGDRFFQENNPVAYFNRLTLTGIDKFPDYDVEGVTYSAIDYLQFINPGDLRVVEQGRSCGRCHDNHVENVTRNVLATEAGILSGASYSAGIENYLLNSDYQDTAADLAFRAVYNPDYNAATRTLGAVDELLEYPVISQYNGQNALSLYNNAFYDANNLANDLYTAAEENGTKTNQVRPNSALASLYHEQIAFTCGDCHLGSAGANNRFGDFRSSGCTACHMAYSPDGVSRSSDPNVVKNEPANPDAIAAPERPHIKEHIIQNVAKTLPNNQFVTGIQDMACAGCHQGSNRTVMQYWGIRLDQNQDLVNNTQYPANPANFVNTATDTRLFDPTANNNTFNGRNANQYIAIEDYDDDGRDDTPPDVHHEAGLGCIDCHGSRDLHGGSSGDPTGSQIMSRQDQIVAIRCESCHGTVDNYAETKSCLTYDDIEAECAVDAAGNVMRHVTRAPNGDMMLKSRLDGQNHYIYQTRDTIVNTNKTTPTGQLVYSARASYAMGRADGDLLTGIGPQQANPNLVTNGFSHTDSMDCVSCHASWTNACVGCHLAGEYDANPANYRFSNITGERIVYNEQAADFIYQSPIPMLLGVSSDNKITQMSPAEIVFYRYTDLNGNESDVFMFSDRNGNGNNPNIGGRNALGSGSHDVMMQHSIRGKVNNQNEGPRYCVTCHLNTEQIDNFGAEYADFKAAIANNDFANLDFNLLQQHIGQNPGNQLNSPFFVHMVAGLGSGLFLFDANGCPVNPLDNNANRQYCNNVAPADQFDPNNAVYDSDHVVQVNGIANSSASHPMRNPGVGGNYRGGAQNAFMSGPLGGTYIQKLAEPDPALGGLVLDSWLDANGNAQGNAANFLQ